MQCSAVCKALSKQERKCCVWPGLGRTFDDLRLLAITLIELKFARK